jgi:hypothetical protein
MHLMMVQALKIAVHGQNNPVHLKNQAFIRAIQRPFAPTTPIFIGFPWPMYHKDTNIGETGQIPELWAF